MTIRTMFEEIAVLRRLHGLVTHELITGDSREDEVRDAVHALSDYYARLEPARLRVHEAADFGTEVGRLLICLLAAEHTQPHETYGSRVIDRVLVAARRADPLHPTYEVRVVVSGVELDFRDWTAAMYAQLDRLVVDAATNLVRGRVDGKIQQLVEVLDRISEEVRAEVRAELGLPRGEL